MNTVSPDLPKKQRTTRIKDAPSRITTPDLVEPKIEEPAKVIPAFLSVAAHDDNRLYIELEPSTAPENINSMKKNALKEIQG
jgi:hypothetical protein